MNLYLSTDKLDCRYTEDYICDSVLYEKHCHGEFEIICILEGCIDLVYEGRSYRCSKGCVLVFPPLNYHSIAADPNTDYKRIAVVFRSDTFPREIERKLVNNADTCPVFYSPALISILSDLSKTVLTKDVNDYLPLIESLIVQTVYHCSDDEGQAHAPNTEGDDNDLIRRAVEYIEAHINEKILLDDLAQALFISKSSLCHLFTEKMQISPKQYILQKKIAYASMLIDAGSSSTDAARAIGYDNYSNFYRIYKKQQEKNNP